MSETASDAVAVQQAVRSRIRELGPSLKDVAPVGMIAVIAGAVLWPVAVPFLGTSAAIGSVTAALGLVSGPGKEYISGAVRRWARRHADPGGQSGGDVQADFEKELLQLLESDTPESAAVRGDVSRLLREVGAVDTALAAASAEVKEALATGLAELSASWSEFRWMLSDLRELLVALQAKQAEGLVVQRYQLDLQREQLVKTNLLLRARSRLTEHSGSSDDDPLDEALPPLDVLSPYKGLEAFQPEDSERFFGREELVAKLLAKLAESPFLAVVGASGSGKSSAIRAGVMPALWEGALPGSAAWRILIMTPGERPLEELALRLSLLRDVAAGSLLDDLRADPARLDLAIRQALADEPGAARLVLVIDQLEEAFTLCRSADERRLFLAALVNAGSRASVLVGIRADFYARFVSDPAFASAVQDHEALVGPMTPEQLRRTIERPAAEAGLSLQPGLSDAILGDLGEEPGALPLLSHALFETWKRRSGRTLALAGYVESGRVSGAIARTADAVFDEQLTPDQQETARGIFLRLTELGEGTEDTRRRATLDELVPRPKERPTVETVVDALAAARLVTTSEETVEVAHEALIRHWPRLRGWLDEDRQALRVHRRLRDQAQQWEQLGRDEGVLYRGRPHAEVTAWRRDHDLMLNQVEREFLDASDALQARETRRQRNRRLTLAAVVAVGVTVSVFFAIQQNEAAKRAARERAVAESRELAASALGQLASDPERALLIATAAAERASTSEAKNALRTALLESQLRPPTVRGDIAAFSPDGRLLARFAHDSKSDKPRLDVWDLESQHPLRDLGFGKTRPVGFSPDGKFLAAATHEGVDVWRTDTWKRTARLAQRSPQVSGIAVSPNGAVAIVCAEDGSARAWNIRSEHPLVMLAPPGERTKSAAFSPDGRLAVVQEFTGTETIVTAWDARRWRRFPGVWPRTFLTSFLSGTRYIVDDTPRIWQLGEEARPEVARLLGRTLADSYDSTAVSPDGRLVLVSGLDGVSVWNMQDGKKVGLRGVEGDVYSQSFSPDSRLVAIGTSVGTTHVFDVHSGRELVTLRRAGDAMVDTVFSNDGRFVVTQGDSVRFWELPTEHAATLGRGRLDGVTLGFSQNRPFAVMYPYITFFTADDPALWRARSRDGRGLRWKMAGKIPGIISPRGQLVASGAELIRAGTATTVLTTTDDVRWFSPDERFVVDEGMSLWDLDKRTKLATLPVRWTVSDTVAIAPGGGSAIIWRPEEASVWSTKTRRRVRMLRPPPAEGGAEPAISNIVFSPDGEIALVLGEHGTTAVWATEGWKRMAVLHGHLGRVIDADISRNGAFIVTAGADGTARVWEASTGAKVTTLEPGGGAVQDAIFTPDGRSLLVASADRTVRLYSCDACHTVEGLIGLAKRRVTRRLTSDERREFLHER